MLNQNPHREIKLPELSPIENTKVFTTATSENLLNQATKENPPQKISITDYLEENSKLPAAFWIYFSLASVLSKNMNIDDFWMQFAMFFPALILFWELLATFPKAHKSSVQLILLYLSRLNLTLYLVLYFALPFQPLISKFLQIQSITFIGLSIVSITSLIHFPRKSLIPDTFKNISPQPEK